MSKIKIMIFLQKIFVTYLMYHVNIANTHTTRHEENHQELYRKLSYKYEQIVPSERNTTREQLCENMFNFALQ